MDARVAADSTRTGRFGTACADTAQEEKWTFFGHRWEWATGEVDLNNRTGMMEGALEAGTDDICWLASHKLRLPLSAKAPSGVQVKNETGAASRVTSTAAPSTTLSGSSAGSGSALACVRSLPHANPLEGPCPTG